jgi:hypothetical protein
MLRPSCFLREGRFAIVMKRWERDAVDARGAERRAAHLAYGEVAWSRRRDAGAK